MCTKGRHYAKKCLLCKIEATFCSVVELGEVMATGKDWTVEQTHFCHHLGKRLREKEENENRIYSQGPIGHIRPVDTFGLDRKSCLFRKFSFSRSSEIREKSPIFRRAAKRANAEMTEPKICRAKKCLENFEEQHKGNGIDFRNRRGEVAEAFNLMQIAILLKARKVLFFLSKTNNLGSSDERRLSLSKSQ